MTIDTVQILQRVHDLIDRGWGKGSWSAWDSEGNHIFPTDDRASSWCLTGAFLPAGLPRLAKASHPVKKALRMAAYELYGTRDLVEFNNCIAQTKQDVLAVINLAIVNAEFFELKSKKDMELNDTRIV